INEAIESGAGFIDFSGHGDTKTWFTYPPSTGDIKLPPPSGYNTTYISTLLNQGKLPVIVVGACNVGRYTLDEHCFCWSLLSQRDGGGIAVFGPTHISFSYIGERAPDGLNGEMQIDLFKAYANGALTVGEMWSEALNIYIPVNPTSTDYLVTMEYQLFGDPMLSIREGSSKPPEKPVIKGVNHGRIKKTYTFKIYSKDPDGDAIYYYIDWGDNTSSSWIGPYTANTTVEVSHTWVERGIYTIKVRARDEHGLMSTWSNPLIIRIRGVKSMWRNILDEILCWVS
ncbi:MAG TPA: PKD domain-containing protein, partial [Thermoplasmatales archaeon]|nr:PKD domain-containing protein [Thermoplasmatales archaeon]